MVGEENIQVKTEVKILSRSPALSMTECLAGARVESCQRGPAADLRRLRVGRQVDHARLDEAAQRRPQPRQPGEEQVATEEPGIPDNCRRRGRRRQCKFFWQV